MNLVIIGGKNPEQVTQLLYKAFDDINILNYGNTNDFLNAVSCRALEIHRMILLQDGIDDIPDEEVYNFVDLIQAMYPAMKLITICKDKETIQYLAELFNSPNYAHFMVAAATGKMLIDLTSLEIAALQKKYKNNVYILNNHSEVEIVEELLQDSVSEMDNTEIDGYVPREVEVPEKRGFFSKVFGVGPKKRNKKLLKDEELKAIGQGVGVDDFSYQEQPLDIEQSEQVEEAIDFSVFGGDNSYDLGLGVEDSNTIPEDEAHAIMDGYLNKDGEEPISLEKQEEDNDLDISNLKDEDTEIVILDKKTFEKEEVIEDIGEPKIFNIPEEENKDIADSIDLSFSVPSTDLISLKETLENTNLKVSQDLTPIDVVPNMDLDIVLEEDIELFNNDLDTLMTDYEESNKRVIEVEKVVEKVVEKIVTVNGGTSPFRNKNGVKILILTGDRRIGSTKLALNLANIYSKKEKVLYVDFDRYRHGSLGYLDLDNLLDEEEHIQNGLNHLKSLNILSNVTHLYKKGGFYTLLSLYGTEVEDKQMLKVQELLSIQKQFTTVIIDCPLDNLYLLPDIIHLSNVLICGEDNRVGIINLITGLSSCCADEKSLSRVFDKSHFIVGRKGNIEKFREELLYVIDLFGLDETLFNWGELDILGSLKRTSELAERIGD